VDYELLAGGVSDAELVEIVKKRIVEYQQFRDRDARELAYLEGNGDYLDFFTSQASTVPVSHALATPTQPTQRALSAHGEQAGAADAPATPRFATPAMTQAPYASGPGMEPGSEMLSSLGTLRTPVAAAAAAVEIAQPPPPSAEEIAARTAREGLWGDGSSFWASF
jgi:hypothetical protein